MNKQFYFISGLPRTGSTLLCNILHQNPDFHVSKATSGCHDVLFNIRNQWDNLIEHQAEGIDYERLRGVLKAALHAYHNTDKGIIFDKGRGWTSLIEMIEFVLQQKVKIIAPVRDITEILASFESLWRSTTGNTQWGFERENYIKSQTVEGRCEIWSQGDQPIGLAYNRLKDAISRGYADRIYFMEMDMLTIDPEKEMKNIYNFLELKPYKHNFEKVVQVTKEDDVNVHKIPGLHTIRENVLPVPHRAHEIIGTELVSKYSHLEFWRK